MSQDKASVAPTFALEVGGFPSDLRFRTPGQNGPARRHQGSVKVDWVERDPSPTALRSPLSPRERAAIFDFLSLSRGRGGTARRWVRGLFADDAFVALYVCGTLDFDGALCLAPNSPTGRKIPCSDIVLTTYPFINFCSE